MKIRTFPILIILISLALVGCGIRVNSTQTESKLPKETQQEYRTPRPINTAGFSPTQTYRSTSTPTSSQTLAFSPTSRPSFTPSSSEYNTAAPLPTWTPRPEPGLITALGTALGPDAFDNSIAVFSPDGKYIILVNNRIRMWDVYTFQLVREFINPDPIFCDPANGSFSSDGRLFAISMNQCEYKRLLPFHIFVWDTETGNLLQDWSQEYGSMTNSVVGTRLVVANSLTFLPNSTRLAYVNKNEVVIRDVLDNQEPVIFDLGTKFFASQISTREDGEFLYVVMNWNINGDGYGYYKTVLGIQIWGLKTKDLRYMITYPEVDQIKGESLDLFGDKLVHRYFDDAKAELTNLTNNETISFLFRRGWQWYSADLRYLVSMRYYEETEQGIEIWSIDTWRNLYTFSPYFETFGKVSMVFSPDNKILAIVNEGHVDLWDISAITKP